MSVAAPQRYLLTSPCDGAALRARSPAHGAPRASPVRMRATNRFRAPVSGFAVPTFGVPLWDPLGLQRRYCYSRSCIPEIKRPHRSSIGFVGAWLGQFGSRVREENSSVFGSSIRVAVRERRRALPLPPWACSRAAVDAGGEKGRAERNRAASVGRRRRDAVAWPEGTAEAAATLTKRIRHGVKPFADLVGSGKLPRRVASGWANGVDRVCVRVSLRNASVRRPDAPDAIASNTRNSG
jgi:hypothetical protein